MKKFLCCLAFAALFLTACDSEEETTRPTVSFTVITRPGAESSSPESSDAAAPASDFKYKASGAHATIEKYLGKAQTVVVPDTINGAIVTKIGSGAFKDANTVKHVELPSTVTEIVVGAEFTLREGFETDSRGRPKGVSEKIIAKNSYIKLASAVKDEAGRNCLRLEFTPSGSIKLAEATGRLLGGQISVWLDGECIAAPIVKEKILDGVCIVAGDFSDERLQSIVDGINGGAFDGCTDMDITFKQKTYKLSQLNELLKAVEENRRVPAEN